MKRTIAVKLIAEILRQRNSGHYSYNETSHASDILSMLEDLGVIKASHTKTIVRQCMMGTPYEDEIEVSGWGEE